MAFYDPSVFEIHVLLVDNDSASLRDTANLLQVNSYKVTSVHEISIASSLLSHGDTKFDIVMIDVNLSDSQGFKLLHDAINMDLPVILMAADVNPTLAKCAIEDGAFLFIQKPAPMDVLKYLWQYVLGEKTRKNKENRRYEELIKDNQKYYQPKGEVLKSNLTEDHTTNEVNKKGVRIEDCDSDNIDYYKGRRPKMCIEWTQELHEKFMDAVKELGEGKCFPKEILELMKVPGLTRMQVASHLQKCRTGWQTPQERQPRSSKKSSSERSKPKKYGLFPRLIRGSQPKFPIQENKIDERVLSGTSEETEDSVQNIGQHGTFDNYVSNISNINEISNENVHENQFGAPNQVVPNSDVFFNLAAGNEGLINGNNFDLQYFDFDQALSEEVFNVTNEEAQGFWNSWVSTFASD